MGKINSKLPDELTEVVDLGNKIYEYSGTGSNCHIVLDDGNIEDSDIDWVLNKGIVENICEVGPKELALERECMEKFKALSRVDRWKVYCWITH